MVGVTFRSRFCNNSVICIIDWPKKFCSVNLKWYNCEKLPSNLFTLCSSPSLIISLRSVEFSLPIRNSCISLGATFFFNDWGKTLWGSWKLERCEENAHCSKKTKSRNIYSLIICYCRNDNNQEIKYKGVIDSSQTKKIGHNVWIIISHGVLHSQGFKMGVAWWWYFNKIRPWPKIQYCYLSMGGLSCYRSRTIVFRSPGYGFIFASIPVRYQTCFGRCFQLISTLKLAGIDVEIKEYRPQFKDKIRFLCLFYHHYHLIEWSPACNSSQKQYRNMGVRQMIKSFQ